MLQRFKPCTRPRHPGPLPFPARMRKGLWSPDEDEKLRSCLTKPITGSWSDIARHAGLQRCGKSCRRRWMNHLRPELKHGKFTNDEILLVIKLHGTIGNKWSEIANHLVGRTDNDVKNLWNTQIKRQRHSHRNNHTCTGSSSLESRPSFPFVIEEMDNNGTKDGKQSLLSDFLYTTEMINSSRLAPLLFNPLHNVYDGKDNVIKISKQSVNKIQLHHPKTGGLQSPTYVGGHLDSILFGSSQTLDIQPINTITKMTILENDGAKEQQFDFFTSNNTTANTSSMSTGCSSIGDGSECSMDDICSASEATLFKQSGLTSHNHQDDLNEVVEWIFPLSNDEWPTETLYDAIWS